MPDKKEHIKPCCHEEEIQCSGCQKEAPYYEPYLSLVVHPHYHGNKINKDPHGAWIEAVNKAKYHCQSSQRIILCINLTKKWQVNYSTYLPFLCFYFRVNWLRWLPAIRHYYSNNYQDKNKVSGELILVYTLYPIFEAHARNCRQSLYKIFFIFSC